MSNGKIVDLNAITSKSLGHSNAKAVLYDVRWQTMRVSMLGTWNDMSTVRTNIDQLYSYITKEDVDGLEKYRRAWRVVNYYNAIRMGFHGQKLVDTAQDKAVVRAKKVISEIHKDGALKYGDVGVWHWDVVCKELIALRAHDEATFNDIFKNLGKRVNFARDYKKMKVERTRRELLYFVHMMKVIKEQIKESSLESIREKMNT